MDALKILLFLLVCVLIYKTVFAISKRCFLIKKLFSLKKECGANVRLLRSPLTSFFHLSKKPDAVVEVCGTVYLIRFINGINGFRHLHFASKNFFVVYKKFNLHPGARAGRAGRGGKKALAPTGTATSSRRVFIIPDMEVPTEYQRAEKTVPVLVFNPAPCEVSYVTEERTSIKVAFTGDEFYGYKIFTASTLATYIDREARRKKEYTARYF